MPRRLTLTVMVLTLILLAFVVGISCSAREDADEGGDETSLEACKEVTIDEILASPEDYVGQRVLVSGRFHHLVKIAIAVDYYWTDWGIGDGSRILQAYLVSDACLFWDPCPNYEENEEVRLPGVVTVNLLGSGRGAPAFLLVSVKNVDIETHPLTLDIQPKSLVGKLIGGTGEVVCVDSTEGRCTIQTAEGVRLSSRFVKLPPEYQAVGLHVRFAGMGCTAGDGPTDEIPIRLYYVEELETPS